MDKILNHTSGVISGVAAIYNREAYLDERTDALDRWAQFVSDLSFPDRVVRPADNVVEIGMRRR